MPDAHAKLSPSSSERWISCPASVRLSEEMAPSDSGDSIFAREGTIAHALAEIEAGFYFGLITEKQYHRALRKWNKEFEEQDYELGTLVEMQGHIADFVQFIRERKARYPDSSVQLEQRLDSGVPMCWGTSDVVLFSPTHIEIIDLKYGAGVSVSAVGNSQLRLYGCGALDTYGDLLGETESITMTVYQPRMENVSSEELDPAELRRWREETVIPRAELALGDDQAPFGPSVEACRWCPVAGICLARVEAAVAEDFGDPFTDEPLEPQDPQTMSPEQMGQALSHLPQIRSWCESVEAAGLEMAYAQGKPIPGYKVVMSGGKRSITDHEGAIKALIEEGYEMDEIANTKAKGIGELEKLLGKKVFPDVLGKYVAKSPGREALVPEDDKRDAISPASGAVKDFGDENA